MSAREDSAPSQRAAKQFELYGAALLGAALFVVASPVIGVALATPLTITCLAWVGLCNKTVKLLSVFGAGWVVGVGWSASLFYWLANLHWGALVLVIAIYACLPAVFAVALRLGKGRLGSPLLTVWGACCWIVIVEFASSDTFAPLPPYGLAYFLWEWPAVLQSASYLGSFGPSFIVAMVGMTIYFAIRSPTSVETIKVVSITALFATVAIVLPVQTPQVANPQSDSDTIAVGAIRTLRDSDEKRDPDTLYAMLKLTRSVSNELASDLDLIVWPETAVPVRLRSFRQRQLVEELSTLALDQNSPLIVGARALGERDAKQGAVFNAAFLVPPYGFISQEYHKVLLAPGMEKSVVPRFFPDQLRQRYPSKLTPGDTTGLLRLSDEVTAGVFICWEVFFPEFVRRLSLGGAHLLVNMSNDEPAFGNLNRAYAIPLPHLVMRAIENQRSVVRSANGGASIAIGPRGRVVAKEDGEVEAMLVAEVPRRSDITVYARYGNLPIGALAIGTFVWGLVLVLRNPGSAKTPT